MRASFLSKVREDGEGERRRVFVPAQQWASLPPSLALSLSLSLASQHPVLLRLASGREGEMQRKRARRRSALGTDERTDGRESTLTWVPGGKNPPSVRPPPSLVPIPLSAQAFAVKIDKCVQTGLYRVPWERMKRTVYVEMEEKARLAVLTWQPIAPSVS